MGGPSSLDLAAIRTFITSTDHLDDDRSHTAAPRLAIQWQH